MTKFIMLVHAKANLDGVSVGIAYDKLMRQCAHYPSGVFSVLNEEIPKQQCQGVYVRLLEIMKGTKCTS